MRYYLWAVLKFYLISPHGLGAASIKWGAKLLLPLYRYDKLRHAGILNTEMRSGLPKLEGCMLWMSTQWHNAVWNHRQELSTGVRPARHKENKAKPNPQTKSTKKTPRCHKSPTFWLGCWLATCQEAAGAGCFPRADDTRGKGNREKEAQAEISQPHSTWARGADQLLQHPGSTNSPGRLVVTNSRETPGQCTTKAQRQVPLHELLRALVTCSWPWHKHLPWLYRFVVFGVKTRC